MPALSRQWLEIMCTTRDTLEPVTRATYNLHFLPGRCCKVPRSLCIYIYFRLAGWMDRPTLGLGLFSPPTPI